MLRVFDLDGVLLDTREAHLAAYREAGGSISPEVSGCDPPDNWFYLPWQTWCPAPVHRVKVLAFPKYMHLVKPLPLLWEIWGTGSGQVVTSASRETLAALHETFRIYDMLRIVENELMLVDRLALLRQWGSGVYYDDSADTCREVARLGGWQVCHVQSPYSYPPQAQDPDSRAQNLTRMSPSL